MTIKLSKPFAANGKVEDYDVRQMKKALNRLGYYHPYEKVGITGIPDQAVFDALKVFQKDQGLQATGEARPGDETVQALSKGSDKTPQGFYIWRTVEDNKVRANHAQYNRTVRAWSDSPDPGEDYNCRCWAEPVPNEKFGPNDCRQEQEALNVEKERLKTLNERKEKIIQELRKLFEERDRVVSKMKETLGIEIASFIIGLPLSRADFIFELWQRYFGNIISDALLKAADRLAKDRGIILEKIDYKRDQLVIVMNELEASMAKLETVQQALQACMSKRS